MSSRFSIEAVFSAIDKMTGPVNRMTGSTTKFSKSVRRDFAKAQRSVERFNRSVGQKMANAVKLGITASLAGLALGLGIATREYIKFDDAIFGATARFKAAEKPGTNMAKVMENLRKAARKVGAETQFTATQASKGLDKFALAGFNSQEAILALRSQVDLATVTGEDFMRVTDISSDLLGGFGGAALKGAEKIEKLKQMNALLAVGTLSANVTMEDLFQTLKSVAPIATQAGKGMEDTIATVSVLGSAGIKGTEAATAMKNIFLRLSDPTRKVTAALEDLNLKQADLIDNTGKLKPTTEIFKLIGDGMKDLTKVKQSAIFSTLFGLRGIAGGAVIAKNIDQIREQLIRMGKDPQEVMKLTAEIMRKSLGNRLKILGSSATELGFKFLEAFDKVGRGGLERLTKAIQSFDPMPIILGMKSIAKVFITTFNIIDAFMPLIASLILIFAAYKGTLFAVAAAQLIAAKATAVWNLVMAANPILLIVGGVIILIGVLLTLDRNWKKLSRSTKIFIGVLAGILTILAAIKIVMIALTVLNPLGVALIGITALVLVLTRLFTKWGDLKRSFMDEGFISTMKLFLGFGKTKFEKQSASFQAFKGIIPKQFQKQAGLGQPTKKARSQDIPAPRTQTSFLSSILEKRQETLSNVRFTNNSDRNVEIDKKNLAPGGITNMASGR